MEPNAVRTIWNRTPSAWIGSRLVAKIFLLDPKSMHVFLFLDLLSDCSLLQMVSTDTADDGKTLQNKEFHLCLSPDL